MKYMRLVNNTAIDVISTDPFETFHPDLAKDFVECPENVENGWKLENDTWSEPEAIPAPSKKWFADDIRKNLSFAEKAAWDNNSAPEIVTAKIELNRGLLKIELEDLLNFLVDTNTISLSSKLKVLGE